MASTEKNNLPPSGNAGVLRFGRASEHDSAFARLQNQHQDGSKRPGFSKKQNRAENQLRPDTIYFFFAKLTMRTNLIESSKKNMRMWALQWRTARRLHDKIGQQLALSRAIIWRETVVTLTGGQPVSSFKFQVSSPAILAALAALLCFCHAASASFTNAVPGVVSGEALVLKLPVAATPTATEKFLTRLAAVESSNNPRAVGDAGRALGLYQFHRDAWEMARGLDARVGEHTNALDAARSRLAATAYLTWLRQQFHRRGIRPSDAQLYAAWNLGFDGFRRRGFKVSNCPATTRRACEKISTPK